MVVFTSGMELRRAATAAADVEIGRYRNPPSHWTPSSTAGACAGDCIGGNGITAAFAIFGGVGGVGRRLLVLSLLEIICILG